MPLCQSCNNKGCGNPVSTVDISIFGIQQKVKVYRSGSSLMAVSSCEGYMPSSLKSENDI